MTTLLSVNLESRHSYLDMKSGICITHAIMKKLGEGSNFIFVIAKLVSLVFRLHLPTRAYFDCLISYDIYRAKLETKIYIFIRREVYNM